MNGQDVKRTDLPPAIQQTIYDAEIKAYETNLEMIDNAIFEMHVDKLAKEKNKTLDEIAEQELKVKEPSEKEIKKFYNENKDKIIYPLEFAKEQVKNEIIENETKNKRAEIIQKIKSKNNFKLSLARPQPPVFNIPIDGYPFLGPENAKFTLVEFADYQCPHCRAAHPGLKNIVKKYPKEFKLVYIDFAVNRSGISKLVAQGAYCARKQNKFWEFHDAAFQTKAPLTKESPMEIAKRLKLDLKSFEPCSKSPEAIAFVEKGKAQGDAMGIAGTPGIFLNGIRQFKYDEASLESVITGK